MQLNNNNQNLNIKIQPVKYIDIKKIVLFMLKLILRNKNCLKQLRMSSSNVK